MKPIPPKAHLHRPIPSSAFPRGFLLGGTHAGIKKKEGVLDLGLAVSVTPAPAAAAGVFTRNAVAAAPVLVSQSVLEDTDGRIRSVVVSSGNANAVTGKKGMEDAWSMVKAADGIASALTEKESSKHVVSQSLVMSTGVIGQPLPIDKVLSGISWFNSSASGADPESESSPLGSTFVHCERAARAFMTTDTFPKLRASSFTAGGREYRIGGMTKGAGMIHPDMGLPKSGKKELHATLLGMILTDAPVTPGALREALAYSVDRSFNSISVDGDMSTNDTLLVLANGAGVAEAELEKATIDIGSDAYVQFRDALTSFAAELAQLVVRDGEGATKFVTVTVDVSFHSITSSGYL